MVSDACEQAGFNPDPLVKISQERTATGKDNATVADIGGEFWWRALQGRTDFAHNCGHAFVQRFADLAIVHGNRLGNALYETSPLDLHCLRFLESACRPNIFLDLL